VPLAEGGLAAAVTFLTAARPGSCLTSQAAS
jgi:hypothetical protein